MRYWHVTIASVGRLTLFPTEATKRAAVRCIARIAGRWLVQFAVEDDHVHIELVCDEARLAIVRAAVARALGTVAAAPLGSSYVKPVATRKHLANNVRYFILQAQHHGLSGHPAIETGSSFQDLVGARVLPGFEIRHLKTALPRLSRSELLAIVELPESALEPASAETLRRAGAFRIAEVAMEVVAATPELGRNSPELVAARRAARRVCDAAGLATTELSAAFGVTRRSIRRYGALGEEPLLERAIRVRISLADAVAAGVRRRVEAG